MTIIFYDIPSTLPGNAWSPNTWKVRYCLNYKNLPYKTEWIEYPDIAAHCQKLGIKPSSYKTDGSPHYTLPAIHDPSTGVYISDSLPIAEYLEKTYPNTPSLFPSNSLALQAPFERAFRELVPGNLFDFALPATCLVLNPPSEEYFRRTRTIAYGKPLADVTPKGEDAVVAWGKLKDGLATVSTWYAKSEGPFLLGEKPSWADFVAGSWLIWPRLVWGEDSAQWKDIGSWQEGRWETLLNDLKPYQAVL